MNILLISFLACFVVALPSESAQKVKWCVKSQNEMKKCQHLATKSTELECYHTSSVVECMSDIWCGCADAITVDAEDVYQAGLPNYDLRPIIAEKYKNDCCHAVAVVKRDTDFNINDLKGKTSCHSCYQCPGGWNNPIGRLVKEHKIPWDVHDDIEKAVSQFFSSSCIPGISKAVYPNLCQACQGDCSCSNREKYYGDEGAFQCLKSGHGQVAFMCHYGVPSSEMQNYQLLCMDGSRKSIEEYGDCYLLKEMHHAVISRKNADSEQIYKVLKQIQDSDLFSSAAFGGKDLMFSDAATELIELPKSMDSFLYLREDYYEAMRALRARNPPPPPPPQDRKIEWCTISHAEHQNCDSLQIPRMDCRNASSVDECIKKIMRKEADAIAVDGGQVYIAGKCGLVPVMVEQYIQERCNDGGEASSYYAVAVVRKGSGVTWKNLKGKKSCHTGLNHSAGWIVPVLAICGQTPDCTLYNFFSKGCAPGADHQLNMCDLCKGSGKPVGDEGRCKASSEEIYYGDDGAFRCLAEKTGEVAFIKHTIVGDYTDGKGPAWARGLKSEDFELICPELPDTTVKYTEFDRCNLAKVPAHAVITREDARKDVVNVLKQAQANPDVKDKLFKSEGGRNLLFSDSTKCLQEITQPLNEFLTQKYIDMIEKTYMTDQGKPDLVKSCSYGFC
ncbi:serotransferrin-1-like [Carassius auratus]|uniref:Serotransferrin n=1 Tax=Carassius auratus TaxID=7957 RepID=A0A6P6R004_CARAU|nr:serotransferrin-1-like [Carassius auratus]